MIVLDTDVFTLLTRSTTREQFPSLAERIAQNRASIHITAITAEEVMRGVMALIRKEETRGKGIQGYRLTNRVLKILVSRVQVRLGNRGYKS